MSFQDGLNKALGNATDSVEIGIGGFNLFARVRETTNYSSIVPTDVLEDGSTATDDIINNPISVSIDGVVGDTFIAKPYYPEIIPKDNSAVGAITALLPAGSDQYYQRILQVEDQAREALLTARLAINAAGKVASLFSSSASKTQQAEFQEYMESIYYAQLPISISTKYREYDSMALADLSIVNDNETGELSFSATFSKADYVTLAYTAVELDASESVEGKVSQAANQGGQNPETNTSKSIAFDIFG